MFSDHDRSVLRTLAAEVAHVATSDRHVALRERWRAHNDLDSPGPLLLVYPEGAWAELLTEADLACHDGKARAWEWELRSRLYGERHFHADNVVEAEWRVPRAIRATGWGLEARRHDPHAPRGAWSFDPVVKTPADLDRLTTPTISVDDEAMAAERRLAEETFGDLLTVREVGVTHVSFHLFNQWTAWRGLNEVYLDMAEDPAFVHAAMRRLTDAHLEIVRQYRELGLLSANNDNTYHSTGGNGYTSQLQPAAAGPADPAQMWASAESQELEPVSPAMHREFALEYERELLAPFGLTGYGCCEGLHHKLADVFELPNIRRISISPFCRVSPAAEQVQGKCIFSFKPQPSHLVGRFDEEVIRGYLRESLAAARGTVCEVILKDTHTCERQPERFDRWTRICREEIDAAAANWG